MLNVATAAPPWAYVHCFLPAEISTAEINIVKDGNRRTSPFKPAVEVAFQNWAYDVVMGKGHKTLQGKLFYCRFGTRVTASYAFETRSLSKQCLRIQSVPPRKHISPFQRSAS